MLVCSGPATAQGRAAKLWRPSMQRLGLHGLGRDRQSQLSRPLGQLLAEIPGSPLNSGLNKRVEPGARVVKPNLRVLGTPGGHSPVSAFV